MKIFAKNNLVSFVPIYVGSAEDIFLVICSMNCTVNDIISFFLPKYINFFFK